MNTTTRSIWLVQLEGKTIDNLGKPLTFAQACTVLAGYRDDLPKGRLRLKAVSA